MAFPIEKVEATSNFTILALQAAEKGFLAAKRAQEVAELASKMAGLNKDQIEQLKRAQQQELCSPTKNSKLKGFQQDQLNSTKAAFNPNSTQPSNISKNSLAISNKNAMDATSQLSNGASAVAYPPVALTYEELPNVCNALRNNFNLTHLDLRRAVPTNTMVDQIMDAILGNQTLIYVNLAENNIGNMKVEEPNLGPLKKIKQFIDQCESLQHIDLSGNIFGAAGTELVCQGVRESISLKKLELNGCYISTAADDDEETITAGMDALKEMLIKNKFLNSLHIAGNGIKPDTIEVLSETLKSTTRLTELNLANNLLGSNGAANVSNILKVNKGIRTLNISDNDIHWKGIEKLADILTLHNRTLESLYLQKNKFGCSVEKPLPKIPNKDEEEEELDPEEKEEKIKEENAKREKEVKQSERAIIRLADMLRSNPVLTELDLGFNSIGANHIKLLADALKTNTSLYYINLERNHICGCTTGEFESKGIQSISDAIMSNSSLQAINLKWNFIQHEGIKILSPSLNANQSLTSLDLSKNFIGDDGLIVLCASLMDNNKLIHMSLASNLVTSIGSQALSYLLSSNTTLHTLDFSDNDIQDGFQLLADSCHPPSGIRCLDCSRCGITDTCTDSIVALLGQSYINKLILADNNVSANTIQAVCDCLYSNKCVDTLTIWGRQDGDNKLQAQMASELLQKNHNITSLDFGFADVPIDLTSQIEELLRSNAKRGPRGVPRSVIRII